MYALAGTLDPDSYLALARATFAEMALAGITPVGEFHYLHHAPGGSAVRRPQRDGRAVIAAAAEAGVRLTLLDACYLHGGIGEPRAHALPRRRRRRVGRRAWTQLRDGPAVRIGAAIHSVRAVDRDRAAVVAGWAASAAAAARPRLRAARRERGVPRRARRDARPPCWPTPARLASASPRSTPRT